MSMSISLQYTWYDAYPDPDILSAVQAVLDAHQPPGVRLDWTALLAAGSDGSTETFSDAEGTYVGVAQSSLIEESKAAQGDPLDLVPVSFQGSVLDLAAAKRPRWRLYPAERALQQWEQYGAGYALEQQRLEQVYLQADRSGAWPRTNQEIEATVAHAVLAIVRIARRVVQYQVPARLFT
jgi:hypothetical protein